MQIDKEVDARGLNCPIPLMKARKALGEMRSGEVLRVVAIDSGSMRDIPAFARQAGHELLEQSSVDNEYVYVIRCH